MHQIHNIELKHHYNTYDVSLVLCGCDLQAARFLGVDIDDRQLQKAKENIEFAALGNAVQLLKGSSMGKTMSNDVIKPFTFE